MGIDDDAVFGEKRGVRPSPNHSLTIFVFSSFDTLSSITYFFISCSSS